MSNQLETINTTVRIISNLLRKLEDKETTIIYLQNCIDNREELIDTLKEQGKQKNENIDNLTKEIETMKKKEDKK